jgi:hypothetical protein
MPAQGVCGLGCNEPTQGEQMIRSTRQTLTVAMCTLIALLGGVLVGPPAAAAVPQTGHFYYYKTYAQGHAANQIEFDVAKVGNKLKVKGFTWTGYTCGVLTVSKKLTVSPKGKFKFNGEATSGGGQKMGLKVTGKFKTKTKAKVTVVGTDSADSCGGVEKATVKRKN